MNKSLCQQLANGLKDPSHSISARSILNQQLEIQFAVFRSDLANILGCHVRAVRAKGALCNAAMAPESSETPVPAKRCKMEEDSTIATQLSMCLKDNKELHKKLDAFDPSKIVEVVTQAVAIKSLSKNQIHTKNQPTHLFCRRKSSRQVNAQIPLANHISGHTENLKLLLVRMAA